MTPTERAMSGRMLIAALRLLPKNAMSRMAGRLVSLRLPGFVQRAEIRGFSRVFGVDLDEVRDPIDSFSCLQDFFVRALAAGARPIDTAAGVFVSPCDGAWGESGIVQDGQLLQLKGRPYSLAQLLGDEALARSYEGGPFATLYLSPRDYHRFHAPCDVDVTGLYYRPGNLWPVNRAGVEWVDSLFAENERITAVMDLAGRGEEGRAGLSIVAVGATMVGKVHVNFDEVTTNVPGAPAIDRGYEPGTVPLAKGEEWGRFEFGSTLVIVAAPGGVELEVEPPGTPTRMGQRIGRLV